MTRIPRHQFFRVRHHHLDRPASGLGEEVAEDSIHQRSLAAEITANRDGIYEHTLLGYIERGRDLAARDEGRLVGYPDIDFAVRVDRCNAGVGFEVALMDRRHIERVLEDAVGLSEAGFDIAVAI